jgi:hypothetical protein
MASCAVLSDGNLSVRLPVERTTSYLDPPAASPGRLTVDGPLILDATGPVTLRGLMIKDPRNLDLEGSLDQQLFDEVAATGANVVRLPVHPGQWRRDDEYLWRFLEPAVRMASEAGLWVIIDWHVIGDVATGTTNVSDGARADLDETVQFWEQVAAHFRDAPNVLLEIVNEPALSDGATWRQTAQHLVDAVRAVGATQPVIVGGATWSKDLSWATRQPLTGDGIVYATHIYPEHQAGGWDGWFGDLAATHPVLLTEWGFTDREHAPDDAYLWGDEGYARALLDYVEGRGIGWIACWYDTEWQPSMRTDGGEPTAWGAFALDALHRSGGT